MKIFKYEIEPFLVQYVIMAENEDDALKKVIKKDLPYLKQDIKDYPDDFEDGISSWTDEEIIEKYYHIEDIVEIQDGIIEFIEAEEVIALEKTFPDCNKCGDYERCAFNYDDCTGFIPC